MRVSTIFRGSIYFFVIVKKLFRKYTKTAKRCNLFSNEIECVLIVEKYVMVMKHLNEEKKYIKNDFKLLLPNEIRIIT